MRIALLLVILSALLGCKSDPCDSEITAFVMAQAYVKQGLKAPSTADFAKINDPLASVVKVGDCSFRVRSYVDAENAFGGTVRTYYSVLMEPIGENEWSGSELKFD